MVSIRLFTLRLVVIAALVRSFHSTEDTTAINRSAVEYCIIKHSTPIPSSYDKLISTRQLSIVRKLVDKLFI